MKYCFKCGLKIQKITTWYGLHPVCFKTWFKVSSLEEFQNLTSQKPSSEIIYGKNNNATFFHGKFRKYSSTLGKDKYILKVEEPEFPELPATEYLCNQIFRYLNINVPPFYLILFEKKHRCFVTQNFMSNFSNSSLVHVYRFFQDNEPYNCENLLKIIEQKVGRLNAQEDFIYLTLADSLIGNNDRHGRNLGFIQSPKGFKVSPFYDNPSYLGTEIHSLLEADHHPTGAIWTKKVSEPSMQDYIQEWQRLGFDYVIKRFRRAVSLADIDALIKKSYLTSKRQKAFSKLIHKRSKELC